MPKKKGLASIGSCKRVKKQVDSTISYIDDRIDTLEGDRSLVHSKLMKDMADTWIEDLKHIKKKLRDR